MAKYAFDRETLQKVTREMIENGEVRVVEVWSKDKTGRKWSVKGALIPKKKLLRRAGGVELGE